MRWPTWQKSTSVAQTLLLKQLDKHSWIAGGLEAKSYRAVVDRVASPAHDIQDVVRSVHLAVNAVQDRVVCTYKGPFTDVQNSLL